MDSRTELPVSKRRGKGPTKRHAGMFGPGGRDPRAGDKFAAAAARWSQDRREFAAMARDVRPQARDTLYALMLDTKVEPAVRKSCAELFLAYSDGRPRQSVDVSVNGPRSTATIPTHELEAMLISGQAPLLLEHNGVVIDAERLHDPEQVESVPQSVRAKKAREK